MRGPAAIKNLAALQEGEAKVREPVLPFFVGLSLQGAEDLFENCLSLQKDEVPSELPISE